MQEPGQGQDLPLVFRRPVTLVGAGVLTRAMLDEALAVAPELVAADSGADRLAGWGLAPTAVMGDMDSIAAPELERERAARLVPIAEQETTDFEKCLYATEAPFYVGVGFTGGRVDHQLAVLHGMLRCPEKTVLLLGEADATTLLPPGRVVGVDVEPGSRVSLFPLRVATGVWSRGLRWPVDGLRMAPGERIGTSNVAVAARVEVGFDAPGVLLIVERRCLGGLVRALG